MSSRFLRRRSLRRRQLATSDVGIAVVETKTLDDSAKIKRFTAMLVIGLSVSQFIPGVLSQATYAAYSQVVKTATMICLSFLMVNVGYEFDVDKTQLGSCLKDFALAFAAAALPWLMVAAWMKYMLPGSLSWGLALLMGGFAAPTSAGILFSMLEAAGLKETWLFKKGRLLAIFDDLVAILLMIPLKVILVGFELEMIADALIVSGLLSMAWRRLHAVKLQNTWSWTVLYSLVVTGSCEILKHMTDHKVHLEVLLPAFTLGCVTIMAHNATPNEKERTALEKEEQVKTIISTIFMLLVGLSIPPLFTDGAVMNPLLIAGHVFVVSLLMTLGKMLLLGFYKKEADFRTRLALSLGMCPRGEVGAGIIAIALNMGVRGPAVTVAVMCLALNLLMSSSFIMVVKHLLTSAPSNFSGGDQRWTTTGVATEVKAVPSAKLFASNSRSMFAGSLADSRKIRSSLALPTRSLSASGIAPHPAMAAFLLPGQDHHQAAWPNLAVIAALVLTMTGRIGRSL